MKFFFSFLLFIGILCFGNSIEFLSQPNVQDVINGSNAILLCPVAGPDISDYTLSWYIGGKLVKYTKRRFQRGNDLYFQPVNRNDDNNAFQCHAQKKNATYELFSDSIRLNIKWSHVDNVELKHPSNVSDIRSDRHDPIVLSCNITGNPTPQNFSWFRNGTILRRNNLIKMDRGRIKITARLAVNDGLYTCCAYTINGLKCTPPGGGFQLNVTDHRIPRLIEAPIDKIVNIGSSVSLNCRYEAKPRPDVKWRKVGRTDRPKDLPNSTNCRNRCVYRNGTLTIRQVRKSTAGEYECFAQQGPEFRSPPETAWIYLAYINQFPLSRDEKFVSAGRKFEYNCAIPSGLPTPTITWMDVKNNKEISEGNEHVARSENTLVIDNIKVEDAATYMCVAENIAGRVTKNVTVSIGSSPRISDLKPGRVDEGANFTWVCPVTGNPEPSVTWFKDGSVIRHFPGRREIVGKDLVLVDVGMSDGGSYKCEARNEVNENSILSNSAVLYIKERLKFSPLLGDIVLARYEGANITCTVGGTDNANITWEKMDGKIGENTSFVKSKNTLTLSFSYPIPTDSGEYRCNASDRSSHIDQTTHISVVARPRILVPPADIVVYAGRSLMLDCSTSREETAKVLWKFESKDIKISNFCEDHTVAPNGSLIIELLHMDDAGLYTCSYEREGLKATAKAEVTVVENPPYLPITNPPSSEKPSTQMIQTIALSVSGGIAYVLITVALIVYCRRKHRKKPSKDSNVAEEEIMLKESRSNGLKQNKRDDEVIDQPMQDLSKLSSSLENLHYPSSKIDPITVIGRGEFGEVFLSKAPGLFPDLDEDILVMVKSFQPVEDELIRSSSSLRLDFNREINLLHKTNHEGIVKLLAIGSEDAGLKPDYLLTEYLEWGILKLCLDGSKTEQTGKFTKINKMSMCSQLACGLDHINKLGLTHNDVATRNCVVSYQLHVKLSILGLSREGFETEYFMYNGRKLPIRWMAPEAIFDGNYSPKSDVWSFGVACWEIFTLAEIPFNELTDEDYLSGLKSNEPPCLPPLDDSKRISSLIKKCCQRLPKDRPEMKQITRKLQSILASDEPPEAKPTETEVLLESGNGDCRT